MKKTEKSFFVQNLTEELKSASSVILVDFTGLNVKSQQLLKIRLRTAGAKLSVVKNTLFKRAVEEAKLDKSVVADTVLSGPTALIITEEDALSPLQILYQFAKEFEIPNLKVGLVEGSFQDKDSLEKLAMLPGKEVLQAQVISAVSAPLHALVGILEANMQTLVFILKEGSRKQAPAK